MHHLPLVIRAYDVFFLLDMEIKPRFRSQRLFYSRQKHQRRKLFNRRSSSPVKDVNRLETALNGGKLSIQLIFPSSVFIALDSHITCFAANKMSCESRSTNFMSEPDDHPGIKKLSFVRRLFDLNFYLAVF